MSETSRPRSAGEAIVVPKDSPIKSVAELKGKKVALNKGSNVHFLLVKLLEKAGVQYTGHRYGLPHAGGCASGLRARQCGCVGDLGAVSRRGSKANRRSHSRRWQRCGQQSSVLSRFPILRREAGRCDCDRHGGSGRTVDQWAKQNPKDAAAALQPQIGLDQATLELALSRGGYGVTPVSDAVLAEQQRIADAFYRPQVDSQTH
jgi:sulfonate transport system substrate-binding protein